MPVQQGLFVVSPMEIIILPYMAISFLIGGVIFSPFTAIDDLDDWTFAKIKTVDIFALFIPMCLLLALTTWGFQLESLPKAIVVCIVATIVVFVLLAFFAGLFVLAKLQNPAPLRRLVLIGLIMPLGAFLTLAWIAVPLLAYAGSIYYSLPATLSFIPLTLGLRALSAWVCQAS